MKNAYGLRYLYNFLNIPFLFLQRETLESMLEANKREIELSYQEMDLLASGKEDSYEEYSTNQVENGSGNHVFSTENKKAAISESKPETNQENYESPNRRRKTSSSSE